MNHSVLRNVVELLAAGYESRGIEHVLLDSLGGDFQGDLLRHAARTTRFLCPSLEFAEEAKFINPTLRHFHQIPAALTEPEPPAEAVRPLEERSIDVFMPCAFYTVRPGLLELRHRFVKYKNPMAKVIDEVYETGMADRDASVLNLFLASFRRHFGEDFVPSLPMQPAETERMEVLSCIDNRIRFDRRLKVLRSLAALDLPLRIVATLSPDDREKVKEVKNNPRIETVGRMDTAEARTYSLHSRFAVNVMPTYRGYVSERVPNAMVLGCCVISDRNRHFAETFAGGREILYLDDCDASGLARYFDADLAAAQDIADRGRAKAREDFAVDHLADAIIAAMREVLRK